LRTISKVLTVLLMAFMLFTGTSIAMEENTIPADSYLEYPMFEHDISPSELRSIDVTYPPAKRTVEEKCTADGVVLTRSAYMETFDVIGPNEQYKIEATMNPYSADLIKLTDSGQKNIGTIDTPIELAYQGTFSPDGTMIAIIDHNKQRSVPDDCSMNEYYKIIILNSDTGNQISEFPIEVMSNPNTVKESGASQAQYANIPAIYWTTDGNQIIYDYMDRIDFEKVNRHTTAVNINYEKLVEAKNNPVEIKTEDQTEIKDIEQPITEKTNTTTPDHEVVSDDTTPEVTTTEEEPVDETENEAPKAGIPFSGLTMGIIGIIGASYLSKGRNE